MSFFANEPSTSHISDPFLDALVTMTSDDPYVYVGMGALKNSDVFTAIRIIASDVASSPIMANSSKMNRLLNQRPNPTIDPWHFKFSLVANMLLNGNSFAEIKRDAAKNIVALNLIPNSEMTVTQDDVTNVLTYKYTPLKGRERQIAPDSVLHFKYFTQDGYTGLSPLYALRSELSIQKRGNELLRGFFASGVQGTGLLKVHKTNLDSKAKQHIRETFEEANASQLGTIVMDDDMDYSKLEVNTDILNLVNGNDWTSRQIAKCFGLPVEKLAVENEHSSNAQSNLLYLQNSLGNYFEVFASEFSAKLSGTFEFDTKKLLSVDPATQQELAVKGLQGGILTVNEARDKIGLAAVEGGDDVMSSLNYTPLKNLVNYQNKDDETDTDSVTQNESNGGTTNEAG